MIITIRKLTPLQEEKVNKLKKLFRESTGSKAVLKLIDNFEITVREKE